MNVIGNMVETIMRDTSGVRREPVPLKDYLQWKKEYVFDALRGIAYGRSFCDRFNVLDFRIFYSRHSDTCDYYIQEHWVERS
jgi:hypothetical protein